MISGFGIIYPTLVFCLDLGTAIFSPYLSGLCMRVRLISSSN